MRQNKTTWFYIGGSGLDRTDDFQKFCGSGLDRIQFHRIRTELGLKISHSAHLWRTQSGRKGESCSLATKTVGHKPCWQKWNIFFPSATNNLHAPFLAVFPRGAKQISFDTHDTYVDIERFAWLNSVIFFSFLSNCSSQKEWCGTTGNYDNCLLWQLSTGKLPTRPRASAEILQVGSTSTFCLYFSGCWWYNEIGRSQSALPFLYRKENVPCYGNNHRNALRWQQ